MNQLLDVTIVSPYEVLFADKALSVSSKNSAGPFDVLPQHANLVTIIENSPIIIQKENKQKITFSFPLAIMYITADKLTIYAQIQFPKI